MLSLTSVRPAGRHALVRASAMVLMAVVALGVLAGPVAAARPVSLNVVVGDYCIDGYARKNSVLKVVVRDSSNHIKGRSATLSDAFGAWYACLDFGILETGDKIKVRVLESGQRFDYKVPKLTLDANRRTNVVSGRGPAGKKVFVEVWDFGSDIFGGDTYDVAHKLTISGSAKWSHDFDTDGIDLKGGAQVVVDFSARGGLVHVYRQMTVPYVYVQIGQSWFVGATRPNKHVSLKLSVGGSRVARGDAVGDFVTSDFSGLFADSDGDTYKIAGGELLQTKGIAGTMSFTIPAIEPKVDLATDKVSGTCFANKVVGVAVEGPGVFDFGLKYGTAAADGSFSIDMTSELNVRRGANVYVGCFRPGGDIVEQDIVAK